MKPEVEKALENAKELEKKKIESKEELEKEDKEFKKEGKKLKDMLEPIKKIEKKK